MWQSYAVGIIVILTNLGSERLHNLADVKEL